MSSCDWHLDAAVRSAGQAFSCNPACTQEISECQYYTYRPTYVFFMEVYMCSAPAPAERTGMASFIDQEGVELKERYNHYYSTKVLTLFYLFIYPSFGLR